MTKSLKGYSVKHKNFLQEEITTLQQAGQEIEITKNHQEECRLVLQTADHESVKEEMRYQLTRANMELKNLYIHIVDIYDINEPIVAKPAIATKTPTVAAQIVTTVVKNVTQALKIEVENAMDLVGTRIWFPSRKGKIQRKLQEKNGTFFTEAFGETYILEHSQGIYFELKQVILKSAS